MLCDVSIDEFRRAVDRMDFSELKTVMRDIYDIKATIARNFDNRRIADIERKEAVVSKALRKWMKKKDVMDLEGWTKGMRKQRRVF